MGSDYAIEHKTDRYTLVAENAPGKNGARKCTKSERKFCNSRMLQSALHTPGFELNDFGLCRRSSGAKLFKTVNSDLARSESATRIRLT